MLMAQSLDGKIAKDSNHFPDWTGREDKKLFVRITKRAGVVIMGSKTFDTIGTPLPNRRNIVMTRNKSRKSHWENLVFTDKSPGEILGRLYRDGFNEVILAGGAIINGLLWKDRLIDEIIVSITPNRQTHRSRGLRRCR